mmetsp:Transcript_32334/g.48785  ORF Transcript_32334/g.48785 Transcript_32334/m.48785 type:complete len:85 (+) Transcript_32334:739-993(+)
MCSCAKDAIVILLQTCEVGQAMSNTHRCKGTLQPRLQCALQDLVNSDFPSVQVDQFPPSLFVSSFHSTLGSSLPEQKAPSSTSS